MDAIDLEIWFPQQNEASVFLESSVADAEEERSYETSLFALFAARQIANLRPKLSAQSLAETLAGLDESRPIADLTEKLGEFRLVSPSRNGGRKGFTAKLRPEQRVFFKMHLHGFGFLAKGVDYYAVASVLVLLAYLLERREDEEYRRALTWVARYVGIVGTQGGIGVKSQVEVAMRGVAEGWMAADSDDEEDDATPVY